MQCAAYRLLLIVLIVALLLPTRSVLIAGNEAVEGASPKPRNWLAALKDGFKSLFVRKKRQQKSQQLQNSTNGTMLEAKEHFQRGNFSAAVDSLMVVLEREPTHQEANSLLGGLLLSLQHCDLAEQYLHAAARLSNWTDSAAVYNMAQCFLLSGDVELAVKAVRRCMEANGNADPTGVLSIAMGDILAAQQKYAESVDWFLAAALLLPEQIELWMKASTLAFPAQHRNWKLAENVLLQALQRNPNAPVLFQQLGQIMYNTNRLQEAVTLYEQALNLDVNNAEAAAMLATILHTAGQSQDALVMYRRAEPLNRNNVVFLANYAMLMKSLGQEAAGRDLAMRAHALDPQNSDTIRAMSLFPVRLTAGAI